MSAVTVKYKSKKVLNSEVSVHILKQSMVSDSENMQGFLGAVCDTTVIMTVNREIQYRQQVDNAEY